MADLEDYKISVEADVKKIAGVTPQLDDTDKPAVSLYGKVTNPGDTPLNLVSAAQQLLKVAIYHSSGIALGASGAASDGASGSYGTSALAQSTLFNGATWDRQRGNAEHILLASAVRTGTTNSSDQVNYNAKGLFIFFSITAVPGVQTVTLTVTIKDPVAGTYEILFTGAAEVATVTKCYLLYPGAGAAANGIDVVNAFPVPRTWRVTVTHSGGGNFTYSVAASLIL